MTADGGVAEPGRIDVFKRYALAGRRYKRLLGGNFMRLPPGELREFGERLAADSREITPGELNELFSGDWRERLTGAWLAGFGLRLEMRDVISRLLLEGSDRHAGKGYCFALARFGSRGDADTLARYLNQSLGRLDLRADQPWALGALIVLDGNLGTQYSLQFIQGGGVWDRWVQAGESATYTPGEMKAEIQSWCSFAEASTGGSS
ncbi:DUF6000 family protein [Streptomyces glomeratus]|uniref:DUF1266 domain-containing protein n=1 Tax=Streptomyces glomeratus TaxID=284452 RepID=A0ABP6M2G2_9ACTN|nr:DUF6000 family protein [Streptomyces glomeratus]MCF1508069.1 DUF6000 family protein [Streptomyces glomeratus]